MTEVEVYAGLKQTLIDMFDNDMTVLTPETTAAEVDGWASFNNLNIIAVTENHFGVKINIGVGIVTVTLN